MKPLQLFINIIVIALFTAIFIYVFMDKTHASELKEYNYTIGCINLDNYADVRKPKNTSLQ